MSNDIPNAKRLIPPDQQNSHQPKPTKGLSYAAIVAMVAVPIVVVGIALALVVRSWAGADTTADLNDTRSPVAEELNEKAKTGDRRGETNTSSPAATSAATSADAPAKPNEAYPDIDPNKEPLAVAVTPSLQGSSNGSGSSANDYANSTVLPPSTAAASAYGHLPYAEADPSRLSSAGTFVRENYERAELLDFEAAQAFERMRQAAQAEGVNLMPVSGFRTVAGQKELFDDQVARKGSEKAAAAFSAPPGHSEHHTGYAIDIADGDYPESDIKYSFEDTPTYQWLVANARAYGFEESFPEGNVQGVTFEPWHWRYVASERARQVFAEAQQRYPSP